MPDLRFAKELKVKKYNFVRRKYGPELLMDCVFFSQEDRKVTIGKPFCYDFHGIFIQNTGRGKISIDGAASSIKRGCFIFLRANQIREYLEVTQDFSGYLLIFENEFTETFFNDDLFVHRFQFFHTNQPPILRCDDRFVSEQIANCERIRAELNNLQNDSHHYLRSLLYNMLIRINRKYIKAYDLSSELYQDNISLQFRKSLEEHIRDKQHVGDYADLLRVSPSQLNRAIKKTSGRSTSTIIRERLLTEIKRNLLYTDKHVSEIAYELGFSDNSNFIRFYKTQTGQTPVEFRTGQPK